MWIKLSQIYWNSMLYTYVSELSHTAPTSKRRTLFGTARDWRLAMNKYLCPHTFLNPSSRGQGHWY